jgi:hypothetical protein
MAKKKKAKKPTRKPRVDPTQSALDEIERVIGERLAEDPQNKTRKKSP